MAEPARRSVLDRQPAPGTGVGVAEVRPAAMALIQGVADQRALDALRRALGLGALPAGGVAWEGDGTRLLGIGAGQWFVVADALDPAALGAALEAALAGTDGVWTDLTHARTVLAVEGERALDVLAKGCPLDLDAAREGFTAASLLGPFPVIVHRRTALRWEVYVLTSLGRALLDWVCEAGAEYGLEAG